MIKYDQMEMGVGVKKGTKTCARIRPVQVCNFSVLTSHSSEFSKLKKGREHLWFQEVKEHLALCGEFR